MLEKAPARALEVVKVVVMNTSEYILLDEHYPLLTPKQMAKAMNLSVRTLANMRSQGRGPAFVRMGAGSRAPIRYLRRQRVAPTK